MAFNINAQIILSQPKNLNNVTKNISKQLGKVTKIDLKIGNVRQLTTLNKQLTTLNNSLAKLNSGLSSTRGSVSALGGSFNKTAAGVKNASKAQNTLNSQIGKTNQSLQTQAGLVGTLGKRFGSVAKQAIAFGLISRPIYDLQRALTGAVKDAVAFEREIVRISQVTGKTVSQLDGLTSQITQLSKSLGISANELAETSRVIAQAGIRGKDLEQVLTALARSTLAPTFGRITDTTEGLIAAFGQFGLRGKDAEAVLGSLNKVSKEFAVEAEDLISVIRRTGGVFAQAAGDSKGTVTALQELTAVFTAVRSTTRESADTIAAGLRTIFSRIQRRSTINFLKQFGVDLTDTQGRFIGIFPAFDQLSKRLDTLIKQGDALTLSAIAEELGGIRQIGKLLPAIAQFDKARKALTEAQKGAVEGLGGDVAKALDTIDNRVRRIRESFNALIRQVFESDAFQGFAKSFLSGSQAIIDAASSIFKTIEPILPLLTALGTVKLGRAVGGLASGALGGGLAGAASTVTGSATAQNTQKTATAVVTQNTLINTTNSTLANMTRQLANLIQINNSGFNTLTAQAARGRSTVVTGFAGGRRRAAGGAIPKFADGGRVYGPSHAAGGVIAELEGGEYVVPKKYVDGNKVTAGQAIVRRSGRREEQIAEAQKTLAGGPKGGIAGSAKGTRLLGELATANAKLSDNPDVFGGIFLRPPGQKSNLAGFISPQELKSSPAVKFVLDRKTPFSGTGPVAKQLNAFKKKFAQESDFSLKIRSLDTRVSDNLEETILDGVINSIRTGTKTLSASLGTKAPTNLITEPFLKKFNIDQVIGNIFEAILNDLGSPYKDDDSFQKGVGNATFDFPRGLTPELNQIFGTGLQKGQPPVDARTTINQAQTSGLLGKVERFYKEELERDLSSLKNLDPAAIQADLGIGKGDQLTSIRGGFKGTTQSSKFKTGFASGGEVPVRISNGEMVVTDPKEVAANRGKLQSINKLATGGFASGTIAKGPGTGTSDSIYTTLPEGAFVVNAASTKKYLGLRRGGLASAGRASGAAFASGGETAGAGIGLVFALQSLTAGLGDGSETLSLFINSVATAAFAVQGLGLEFGNIGKTLGNALGKIPGVASGAGDRLDVAKRFKLGFAGRVRAFGGVGGTAAAGVGAAAGGAVIGKVIGDIAGKAIADSFFGKQEELAGFKGSASAEQARARGALEGGISGLGAGAGAGAGIGFVLGGPVGAAIGAAIGGGAGFLIGQAFGEQNAALEQAAFEAAKALQKSGENVSKSLDELEKEFTISGFGDLTKSLGEQQVNFNDAVTKFSNKFNDEITLTSLSLDFTRAIPGIDAAFAGLDNLFGTTLSAANEARNNASKAFIEASKLINPDDIKRAKVQLNASLDKFLDSFEVEDLAAVSGVDLVDSLREAANAGDTFAKNILKAADSIASAELAQTTSLLLQGGGTQQAQGQLLTDVQALRQQNPNLGFREAGERVATFERAQELFPREFLESQNQYRVRLSNIVNGTIQLLDAQDRQIETTAEEARQRGIVNKALQDTTEELENLIKSLRSPFVDLAFQVQTASDSFDVFKANIDRVFAGEGGFQTRGIQAGAFESDSAEALAERERVFRALDNITPGGAAGSRAAQRLRDEGPEIVKDVLEKARDTASSDKERLTPDVLLTRLETAFGNAGFQLPSGITDILTGISRQGEDGTAIPENILAELIKSDKLTQKFGEVFDAAAEGPAKFAEQLNKAIQLSEKRIAVETDLLKKQRDLAKSITELQIATQDRSEQILSGTAAGAPTGTEIPDAIDRLTRRVVSIAGTADSGELLSRRGAALGRQAELQRQIEENPALALNEDIEKERVALANEISQTTEALNLLATETETFSKIIEKANRIGQNIGALETGLEDVIDKVTSGDVAGVRQLAVDQATIGAALNGVATLPQALNALKALGQEQNKALVDVATGVEGSGDALRRTLLSQVGARLASSGGVAGQVAGRYLLGILQQEQKAFALDQLQKERAAKQEELQKNISEQNTKQVELLKELNNKLAGDAFKGAVDKFNQAVDKFISRGGEAPTQTPGGSNPNRGYFDPALPFAAGGSIFKPRGTDTVPAMLTPGEYVVKKSAVDQYGPGVMDAINSGNAQVFAASGGKVGKGVIYRQHGGTSAVGAAYRQRDTQAESKRLQEKQQEFIALSDQAARNGIVANLDVDFSSLSSIENGINVYRGLISDKNRQRGVSTQASRSSILPPDRVSAEGITFRGGRPSLADTNFNLTQAERNRFQAEELGLYKRGPNVLESALDYGATTLRRSLIDPLDDAGVESTGNRSIDEALGNQTLFQSQVENVRLRERQAELQKQNRLAESFFGSRGLAGDNLNNLADIEGRGPDEVRFTGSPTTGRKVQEALVSQAKDEIAAQRAIDDFKARNTPSLLAAQAGSDITRRTRGDISDLSQEEIAQIKQRNKEREQRLTFQGSITADVNRGLASVGLEQIENPNQVFVDAELARRENEAAKARVEALKKEGAELEARGTQLRQQQAAQTAATDTSSAVGAAAQQQETAAQAARRLRNKELEARRKANQAARQQADEDARIRREQTGGLNQEDERAFRDDERAKKRAENQKKSDEARKTAATERKARDLERVNRLEELNNISNPLERSARRRELDQERRARNRSRARGSEAAASGFAAGPTSAASPGIAGLSSLTDNTVGSRGAEAQKRREDRAVAQFRAQFNNAVVSQNFQAARAIAQRYFSSGDISPETQSIIKSQIDAAAPRFAPGVQLYNKGGKVRGFNNGGNVPIMAQAGEFVMSRNAVSRLGIGSLTRMNQGLPTFHDGGPVYKQFGGRVSGRGGSNGPQTAVVINGSDAAKELNNAIITGGETVKQSWQTLFDTVAEGLNSALSQVSTIPNQINATIAPVQIEGVGSFTEALAAQIVPKIVEQIAPLIGNNTNGGTTEQGAGV